MTNNFNQPSVKNFCLIFIKCRAPDNFQVQRVITDIINMAVKTPEVDEQKTKYLQHSINKHDTIVSN
jgi:hypothetical protein